MQTKEEKRALKKIYDKERHALLKTERQEQYLENREKILLERKAHRLANLDKLRAKDKRYGDQNRDRLNIEARKYRSENSTKIAQQRKDAVVKDPQKRRTQQREYYTGRIGDPLFKFQRLLRGRLRDACKGQAKVGSAIKLLGCTPPSPPKWPLLILLNNFNLV